MLERAHKPNIRQAAALFALLFLLLLPEPAAPQAPHPDPYMNPIPQFNFNESAKSMLIKLHFDSTDNVTLVSAEAFFGLVQTNLYKPAMLQVELLDHYDAVSGAFNEWHPRHVEVFDDDLFTTMADEAIGLFTFPFDPALRAMTVSGDAQALIEVDLVGPILDFCAANPNEPECGVDLEILSMVAVDPPTELIVGEPIEITLHKLITNNGPLGIMDTLLTAKATATVGSTIIPPQVETEEPQLIINEEREVEEVFTFECQGFSQHPITFENEITPLNPVFVDPNPNNNVAEVEVPIECVMPVAINIKPHSDPNSINTRSGGNTPLAILTTAAGEYGLPLAFDATRIIPNSVLFGPRDVVFAETGGATEGHGRGHVEDSYELDEKTRDGDQDMVLHFTTRDAGLQPGDTEACVKGQWLDGAGNPHKFFGCDAVRIVK